MDVVDAKSDVKVIETKIVEYSATAAGLAELQHRFRGVVFDVSTTKGLGEAKAARYELVKLRSGLESKRREIKAPALERSRLIDSEANRINAFIAELEVPVDEQIKAEEQRKEAEKQARIDAEVSRVQSIRDDIASIAGIAVRSVGLPSTEVEKKIKLVVAIEIGPKFAEFAEEAKTTHAQTLTTLRELHLAAIDSEAKARQLAADQADLERLRKEDAERKRVEEARAAAARKEEDARLAAARAQLEADQRAAAAERKAADDEAAAERAEQDRLAREQRAAEQRRIDAERAEQRRHQIEADRVDRAAREAEDKRIADARAELELQQAARDAERHEAEARAQASREQEQREIEARAAAEAAAITRLQGAAQQMLDALLLWRTVDASRLSRNTDGYKGAAAAREAAIAEATGI